jgi:hypothetical protein
MLQSPKRADHGALEKMDLKFYNFDLHKAAFSLPNFVQKVNIQLVNV